MTFFRRPQNLLQARATSSLDRLLNTSMIFVIRDSLLLRGGFNNILFSDAPDIIVEGVAVWAARRPNLLVGGCFRQLRSFFVFSNHRNFVTSDMN